MMDWILADEDIAMSEMETQAVQTILASDCGDPIRLIGNIGYDPNTFFKHGNWEGMDFRHSNVSGVSFEGAIMTGAIMYRDQYELIRKTFPRTLNLARVQEDPQDTNGSIFTVIADKPIDPDQARSDFLIVLDEILNEQETTGKYQWSRLIPYVQRLEVRCRHWALDLALNRISGLPNGPFIEACHRGYSPALHMRPPGEGLATQILNLVSLDTTMDRLKYLRQVFIEGAHIERRLQGKLSDLLGDIAELRQAINVFMEQGWPIELSMFSSARFAKTMRDARDILALMAEANVRPDTNVFRRLVECAKTINGAREILELMSKANVSPDLRVFRVLAECAKTIDGVREILALITKANLAPDAGLFSRLAEGSRNMEGVREILALMSEANVRPDASVFRTMAKFAKNNDDAREILALMSRANVNPDSNVFSELTRGSKNIDDARGILMLMSEANVRPDSNVFSELTRGIKNIDDIRDMLALMSETGTSPDERHYKAFITACASVEEASDFLIQLEKAKDPPNVNILNQLLDNTADEAAARKVWSLYSKYDVAADRISFNILIKRMETRAQLHPVIDEMRKRMITADKYTVRSIVSAALSEEDAAWGLEQIRAFGFDPTSITPETLDNQADRFRALLSRMQS